MSEVIYEVDIRVENETKIAYMDWLQSHIDQMLGFEGFKSADVFEYNLNEESLVDENHTYITVHYHVDKQESLAQYQQKNAHTMQEDAINKFGDKFSAKRRVLTRVK